MARPEVNEFLEYNNSTVATLLITNVRPEVAHVMNSLRGNSLRHLFLVQIPLDPYPTFRLEKAVCNHGFFMMAPNNWDPVTKTLARPLRLDDLSSSSSVIVLVRQVQVQHQLSVLEVYVDDNQLPHPPNLTHILNQVKRMLRISPEDEIVSAEFQKLYPDADVRGFGRIFRSPTLFEDIVKSLLLSHCGWCRSLAMSKALCELQFGAANSLKNFPTAEELAQLEFQSLERGNLGYRSKTLSSIVDKVVKGRLQLDKSQDLSLVGELMKISGIGSFIAANISMCMGFYSMVPIDSETKRHLREVHGIEKTNEKTVKDRYQQYAPYDSLAYWFELHMFYESKFGDLSVLPTSAYHLVTSSRDDHHKTGSKLLVAKTSGQSKKIVKKKKKKGRCEKKSRKLLFTM